MKEILQKEIVTPKIWKEMKKAALAIFERGQKICQKAGAGPPPVCHHSTSRSRNCNRGRQP